MTAEPAPSDPATLVERYLTRSRAALDRVEATQLAAVAAAADLFLPVIAAGGVVHCFGTGHSRIVTLELCARAGGLACFAMIAVKDLVMFGDTEPARILDPTCEREIGLGRALFELSPIEPGDALLVVSNSGRNASVVELTRLARAAGMPVAAITSLQHTRQVTSGHPSGQLLVDLADVVIDNGAPLGDAALDLPDDGQRVTALSSLTGVHLAQLLTAAVTDRLIAGGVPVPVLTSQNVAGGDGRNAALYRRYRRIRPIEP